MSDEQKKSPPPQPQRVVNPQQLQQLMTGLKSPLEKKLDYLDRELQRCHESSRVGTSMGPHMIDVIEDWWQCLSELVPNIKAQTKKEEQRGTSGL